jgi:hypothetical protein
LFVSSKPFRGGEKNTATDPTLQPTPHAPDYAKCNPLYPALNLRAATDDQKIIFAN